MLLRNKIHLNDEIEIITPSEQFITKILEIKNKFFGEDINVAGLIVGEDIIKTIENKKIQNLIVF